MKTAKIIALLLNIISINYNACAIWILVTIESEKSIVGAVIWMVINFISAVVLLHSITKEAA